MGRTVLGAGAWEATFTSVRASGGIYCNRQLIGAATRCKCCCKSCFFGWNNNKSWNYGPQRPLKSRFLDLQFLKIMEIWILSLKITVFGEKGGKLPCFPLFWGLFTLFSGKIQRFHANSGLFTLKYRLLKHVQKGWPPNLGSFFIFNFFGVIDLRKKYFSWTRRI